MVHFYTKCIVTSSTTIWYDAATAKDKGRLQHIIRFAEKWLSTICHPCRTCTPPGEKKYGQHLPLQHSPLQQEAAVHEDQKSYTIMTVTIIISSRLHQQGPGLSSCHINTTRLHMFLVLDFLDWVFYLHFYWALIPKRLGWDIYDF